MGNGHVPEYMRIIATILFFCLLSVLVEGQVIKPKSNPPVPVVGSAPPPPPNPGVTSNNNSTGLRLLKIPVTDSYYLGMDRNEFDSIRRVSPLTIKTDKAVHPLKLTPYFIGKRVAYLDLTVDSSFFSADGTEITSLYLTKLGPPDEKQVSDTLVTFPQAFDSTLNGPYRVKTTYITWHFKHHDVVIYSWMIDLRNGTWKGYYVIRYGGNALFRDMLREMEYKEGY